MGSEVRGLQRTCKRGCL